LWELPIFLNAQRKQCRLKISIMQVKIINNSKHALPSYETEGSAGMDIRANIDNDIVLKPMQREVVPTGISIELPLGYEAQIRPRSGLAAKRGVTVLNTPGTIDSDYRGEIRVILINLSDTDFVITNGERIAQIIMSAHERVEWAASKELIESERGSGGFGSTGLN